MRFNEITKTSVTDKFEEYINGKYDDVVFMLHDNKDIITLSSIIVNNKKAGVGTQIMNELIDFADENNKRIILTPGTKDDHHGTTSRTRLVKFYKRFGFVENKGRNKDFSLPPGMIREPR